MDITLSLAVLGTQEIALVAIGILVLFGAKKLPELARGMGEGMREFKKAVKDIHEDEEPAATPSAPPPAAAVTREESTDAETRVAR